MANWINMTTDIELDLNCESEKIVLNCYKLLNT